MSFLYPQLVAFVCFQCEYNFFRGIWFLAALVSARGETYLVLLASIVTGAVLDSLGSNSGSVGSVAAFGSMQTSGLCSGYGRS